MASGLGQQTFTGIDKDDGNLSGGGSGNHVAGVLFVTGGVGDDELTLFCGEVAVGHVDGDPLFTFRLQSVEQQCIVDGSPLGADLFTVRLQRLQLIFKNHLRIPEQPPDQGAFTIIDTAAGYEAEHGFFFMAFEVGEDITFDQF